MRTCPAELRAPFHPLITRDRRPSYARSYNREEREAGHKFRRLVRLDNAAFINRAACYSGLGNSFHGITRRDRATRHWHETTFIAASLSAAPYSNKNARARAPSIDLASIACRRSVDSYSRMLDAVADGGISSRAAFTTPLRRKCVCVYNEYTN
jgi:hypothetical protein